MIKVDIDRKDNIMKRHLSLTLLGSLFLFTACVTTQPTVTYEQNIKEKLHIENVFIPPSNAYPPYTLLHYLKGRYQQVCSSSDLIGLPVDEIKKNIVVSTLSDTSVATTYNGSYAVSLSKTDMGASNIGYKNIKEVTLNLKDGQLISMPSVHVSDVMKNILTGKCAEDIKYFKNQEKKSRFYVPRELYRYTMKYSILNTKGVEITAKLSENLQQIILAKAGIEIGSQAGMNIEAKKLYIGFNGIERTEGIVPKNIRSNATLDVTDLIREVRGSY